MEAFENWLLENYGFEADMTPIKCTPPRFVKANGMFDVAAYESWKDARRVDFSKTEKAGPDAEETR